MNRGLPVEQPTLSGMRNAVCAKAATDGLGSEAASKRRILGSWHLSSFGSMTYSFIRPENWRVKPHTP